jgi:hypothetical protein
LRMQMTTVGVPACTRIGRITSRVHRTTVGVPTGSGALQEPLQLV